MSDVRLEMTVELAKKPHVTDALGTKLRIRVRVEYDDGMVAYAESIGIDLRCSVFADGGPARWERRASNWAGDVWYIPIDRSDVWVISDRRDDMERAARAGMVAVGSMGAR